MSSVDTTSTTASSSDGGEKDEKTDTATDDAIEFGDVAASEYLPTIDRQLVRAIAMFHVLSVIYHSLPRRK